MYALVFYADDLREAYLGRPTTYTKVWEGEVAAPEDRPKIGCELLFERFNIGDHGGRADIRSMSVGDRVEIAGVCYLCEIVGFRRVEEEGT